MDSSRGGKTFGFLSCLYTPQAGSFSLHIQSPMIGSWSLHGLQCGLLGYLILFAPHTLASERQYWTIKLLRREHLHKGSSRVLGALCPPSRGVARDPGVDHRLEGSNTPPPTHPPPTPPVPEHSPPISLPPAPPPKGGGERVLPRLAGEIEEGKASLLTLSSISTGSRGGDHTPVGSVYGGSEAPSNLPPRRGGVALPPALRGGVRRGGEAPSPVGEISPPLLREISPPCPPKGGAGGESSTKCGGGVALPPAPPHRKAGGAGGVRRGGEAPSPVGEISPPEGGSRHSPPSQTGGAPPPPALPPVLQENLSAGGGGGPGGQGGGGGGGGGRQAYGRPPTHPPPSHLIEEVGAKPLRQQNCTGGGPNGGLRPPTPSLRRES
ncbi:hypothetical protein G9A89_017723 [Geosiphon pyriformis]|nr:hypothetical protein G9A89_017723 [Geosiphon pyriformis]